MKLSIVIENKIFLKVLKLLFNGKGSGINNEIILLEENKILRDDIEVAKELHFYFNSIVSSLGITENKYVIAENITSSWRIDKAIEKFQFHPSILLIKSKINKLVFHSDKSTLMMLIKKCIP